MKSSTQGSRPRTHKNPRPRTAFPKTEPLEAKDRYARGQGQGQVCSRSRPRTTDTRASDLHKKGLQNFFQVISKKKEVFKFFFKRFSKKSGLQKLLPRTSLRTPPLVICWMILRLRFGLHLRVSGTRLNAVDRLGLTTSKRLCWIALSSYVAGVEFY